MATVDLERLKKQAEQEVDANYSSTTYGWFRCPPEVALALIRRVERLTVENSTLREEIAWLTR